MTADVAGQDAVQRQVADKLPQRTQQDAADEREGCSTVRRHPRQRRAPSAALKILSSPMHAEQRREQHAGHTGQHTRQQPGTPYVSALMPFSSTSRWLSTTVCMRRPIGVQRNSTVSTITVRTLRDERGDAVRVHRETADVSRRRRPRLGRVRERCPRNRLDRLAIPTVMSPDRRHELRQRLDDVSSAAACRR